MAKEKQVTVVNQKSDPKTEEKAQAVAVVGSNLPAFMSGGSVEKGSDNFDGSDVVIPRVKLLHGTSKELEAFDEAKAGLFWHTGMDIPLGTSIRFVVADRRKKYLLVAPLNDGQGILARADDAMTWDKTGKWTIKLKDVKQPVVWEITDKSVPKSGLTNWGTSNPGNEDSPPAATLFYDYLVFLPDHLDLGPCIVSLARASIRQAKKGLNDKIQLHRQNGRPMQGLVFSAESFDDAANGNDFKNWRFKSAGFVQDENLFNMAKDHVGALASIVIAGEAEIDQPETKAYVNEDDGSGKF